MEMMIFFAHGASGTFKTKLNKLLWYSDFLHYHRNAVSISGATYHHLPFGPVPDHYDICLSILMQNGTLVMKVPSKLDWQLTLDKDWAGIVGLMASLF